MQGYVDRKAALLSLDIHTGLLLSLTLHLSATPQQLVRQPQQAQHSYVYM
jgi:hypothetical protein